MPCANVSGLPMFGCCVVAPSGVSEHYYDAIMDGFNSLLGIATLGQAIQTYRIKRVRSVCTLVLPTLPPEDVSWTHEYYDEHLVGQDENQTVRITIEKSPSEPEFTERVARMNQVTSDSVGNWSGSPTTWHEVVTSQLHGTFLTHDITLEVANPLPQELIALVNAFDPASIPVGTAIRHRAPLPWRQPGLPPGEEFPGNPIGRMVYSIGGPGSTPTSILPTSGSQQGPGPHARADNVASLNVQARNYRMSSPTQWGKLTKRRILFGESSLDQYFCLGQIQPPINSSVACEQATSEAVSTVGSIALFIAQGDAICP